MSTRQYTCVNDKSGTEIYEGDIVIVDEGGNIGWVMYGEHERYHYVEFLSTFKGVFDLKLHSMGLAYRNIRDIGSSDLEVTGNIHEPQYY